MCFKAPSMPAVEQIDTEAQQRQIDAQAQARAQRDTAAQRSRRRRSALDVGRGTALGLYGGGSNTLGGRQ